MTTAPDDLRDYAGLDPVTTPADLEVGNHDDNTTSGDADPWRRIPCPLTPEGAPVPTVQAPTLPPGCHWRRRVSPTVEPWRAEPIDPDAPDAFDYGRTGWSPLRWESKDALSDGDEFEHYVGGEMIRLTVGAPA